jgi:hypothetical protein
LLVAALAAAALGVQAERVKLGTLDNPCRHTACDRPARLQRRTFTLTLRVVSRALRHR